MILEPSPFHIARAASALFRGELVAFPTETVYGLGALATDTQAVERIFLVKGRPRNNPLIIHLANVTQAKAHIELTAPWMRENFETLSKLWPAPLSLVLPLRANSNLSKAVTGGGNTVALRIPAHPVALALLQEVNAPLAAPSANRSEYVSPTTAEHVEKDLGGEIAFVLDGGPCEIGLESTVVSLLERVPQLLRPGAVTLETLEERIGKIEFLERHQETGTLPSPGMLSRHYAPHTPLFWYSPERLSVLSGKRFGYIRLRGDDPTSPEAAITETLSESGDLAEIAKRLYASIRKLDALRLDAIVISSTEHQGLGLALYDRMKRAVSS